jgi:glucosamine--fructose-6-phosphate aminotransferase (isomerizing)
MALADEIAEQPEVAARLLAEAPSDLAPLVAAAREAGIEYVMFAARGTSDHAATYGQYALGSISRLPVALAAPSLFSRYVTPPRLGRALVVGVSQSGRSPDVVGVVEEASRQGALTAAITNAPKSPLAAVAAHVVALRAGPEASVAATKTYTAELMVVAMLAAALSTDPEDSALLSRIPAVMREALAAAAGRAAELGEAHREMDEAVVLGRGFNLSTALEWALKLKELAYVRAQGYSSADFQHGPVASLSPGGRVLAVSAAGPLAADLSDLFASLARDRSARLVLVAGADAARPAQTDLLPFPDVLPEWLSPLIAILPAQLFGLELAKAKGLDGEQPRGLSKVTLTR